MTAIANGTAGRYKVLASATGAVLSAGFDLTDNLPVIVPLDTTTTLNSSLSHSTVGQGVVFTATVAASTGTGTPTGRSCSRWMAMPVRRSLSPT